MAKEPQMYVVTRRPREGQRENLDFHVVIVEAASKEDAIARSGMESRRHLEAPLANELVLGKLIRL